MAIKATLKFNDSSASYVVLECDYEYRQETDRVGKPSGKTTGNIINLVIEARADSELVTWMLSRGNLRSGKVEFYASDSNKRIKTLSFSDAYCVRLRERFVSYNDQPMITSFTLSAQSTDLDGVTLDNNWD
jgi:hypothetical protein